MSSNVIDIVTGNESININSDNQISKNIDNKVETTTNNNSEQNNDNKKYTAVSKNGDTLELSGVGKKNSVTLKSINNTSSSTQEISDATLSTYSSVKLKQLYSQNEITKQQYDKAMNNK